MTQIEVKNNGPLPMCISIVLPEEGGITELRGQNGAGKTETLEAIAVATTGKGTLNRNRSSDKASVEMNGAIVALRQRQTRTGEFDVNVLPGKFSVDEIVDPGIDEAPRADAARLRALAGMASADMAAVMPSFYELVGGKDAWEKVVPAEVVSAGGSDILAVAGSVKRHFEQAKRKANEKADSLLAEANGIDLSVEDIEDIILDKSEIDANYAAAVQRQGVVHERLKVANSTREENARARAEFEKLSTTNNISVPDAETDLVAASRKKESAVAECEAIKAKIEALNAELAAAKSQLMVASGALEAANSNLSAAKKGLEAARSRAAAMEGLRASIQANCPDPPTAEELAAVDAEVDVARIQVERLGTLKHAREQRAVAANKREQAKTEAAAAARFLEWAIAVEEVVTKFVRGLGLEGVEIRDGRIYSQGKEFHELSEGERYFIAIPAAVSLLRRKDPDRLAILTISQEGWASLQPSKKWAIHQLGLKLRVNLITAVASDLPATPGVEVCTWAKYATSSDIPRVESVEE